MQQLVERSHDGSVAYGIRLLDGAFETRDRGEVHVERVEGPLQLREILRSAVDGNGRFTLTAGLREGAAPLQIAVSALDSVRMFPSDTDDKARAAQLEVLRRLGPSERVRVAAEMSEEVRRIAFEAEQRRHPELSPAEARQGILDRIWGPDLAAAVRRARAGR